MTDQAPGLGGVEKVRTSAAASTYGVGMTIENRAFGNPDHPYKVVTERLITIEEREYVRCPTHGLIPLDHYCGESPHDHWCRTAAHPDYDPATGVDGLEAALRTVETNLRFPSGDTEPAGPALSTGQPDPE